MDKDTLLRRSRETHLAIDPYSGGDEPWDTDAWNARILAGNRDRSAADVRRGEDDSFARLVAAVEGSSRTFAEPRRRRPGCLSVTRLHHRPTQRTAMLRLGGSS